MDELWQNYVDELVRWREQADLILVKVRIQIRRIGGIQNVNYSVWRQYVLFWVPFRFAKCHSMSDFSPFRNGAKNDISQDIAKKVADELWQNYVDELVRWQEQAN